MKVWAVIRLLCALVLCGAAALVLVQAPTILLFMVALVVTEFGHWIFLLPLVLAFLPMSRTPMNLCATALFLTATILLLSPALRASAVARHLPGDLARCFARPMDEIRDEAGEPGRAFSWKRLWFAPAVPKVPVEHYTYANHEGQPLQFLYYHNSDTRPAPCVVVIHGGGWENGSAGEAPTLNHYLAQRGYAVADIEYRLAPRWAWPAQREDVLDAMDYLEKHADELHLDPQRFVLLGRSAGGQIAEAVAYGAHRRAIRGCIAFYAPADMNYAYEFGRSDDILDSPLLLRQFLGGTPKEAQGNYDSASGILLADRESPPTLLLHGQRDELVWVLQSKRLSARLDALGTPHCFVQLPWATHAFDYNFDGPGGQISMYAVERFLSAVLR